MSRPDFMKKGQDDGDDGEDKKSGRPDFMKKATKKVEEAAEAAGRPDFMKSAKEKASETVEDVAEKAKSGRPDFMKKTIDQAQEAVEEMIEGEEAYLAEYTVQSGDNLSFISKKFYETPNHWKAIYEENKDVIGDNPNLIRVGQVLKIPKM